MAFKTVTLTADTAGTYIASIVRRPDAFTYEATVMVYGTWGSGTIAWHLSPDGGTTLIPLPDLTGVAITSTANGMFEFRTGAPHDNTHTLKLYAVLTGSTNPSLTINVYDNR